MDAKEMVKLAIKALEDKKGEDIRIIDIRQVSVLARCNTRGRTPA